MQKGNWIDGCWSGALKKNSYVPELRFALEAGRGAWPRSDASDLERAVQGLRRGALAWQALGPQARRDRLERVLDRWQAHGEGLDLLAQGLGLEAGQLDGELERALDCGDRLLAADEPEAPIEGALLAQIAADQMHEGLLRALFPALLAGQPVLLLADKDLPWLSQEFVAQLATDEILGGSLALLHDDRAVCEAAAIRSGFFEETCFSVAPQALPSTSERASVSSGFGAGLLLEPQPPQALCTHHQRPQPSFNGTTLVTLDMDPRRAAARVWRAAFDPVEALSGQRSGQIGRVICHERLFSSFSTALLEQLDAAQEDPGCQAFVAGLERHVERLCRLGLDEGASLLRGGDELHRERSGRQAKQCRPALFTNVEANMGLAQSMRPAPVLSILRASSDAEARTLLAHFETRAGAWGNQERVSRLPTSGQKSF